MAPLLIQRYHDLETDDTKLRRLTDFKREEFESFYQLFNKEWQTYFTQFTLDGVLRIRQASIRKNSIFSDTRDALLFGLIYLKGDVRQDQLAIFFGVDQPKVSKYLALIKRIIHQVIENNPRVVSKRKQGQLLNALL